MRRFRAAPPGLPSAQWVSAPALASYGGGTAGLHRYMLVIDSLDRLQLLDTYMLDTVPYGPFFTALGLPLPAAAPRPPGPPMPPSPAYSSPDPYAYISPPWLYNYVSPPSPSTYGAYPPAPPGVTVCECLRPPSWRFPLFKRGRIVHSLAACSCAAVAFTSWHFHFINSPATWCVPLAFTAGLPVASRGAWLVLLAT